MNIRTCSSCNASFTPTSTLKKYCSVACRTITCAICGESFESYHRPARKYCSRACMGKSKALPPNRGRDARVLRCGVCAEDKPVDEFHVHNGVSRGRQYHCKTCQRARPKSTSSPTDHRRWSLKTLYGLTVDQYAELFAAQDGRCAICQCPKNPWTPGGGQRGRWRSLVVDHDHRTNRLRGLLCVNCNIGLGHFKDSAVHLAAALTYLTAAG